jgi:hypothetical protein
MHALPSRNKIWVVLLFAYDVHTGFVEFLSTSMRNFASWAILQRAQQDNPDRQLKPPLNMQVMCHASLELARS